MNSGSAPKGRKYDVLPPEFCSVFNSRFDAEDLALIYHHHFHLFASVPKSYGYTHGEQSYLPMTVTWSLFGHY
jgi:hypothetical protein